MWLGLDGEGIGRTPHRYVMMGISDAAGNHDIIERNEGLTTKEVLQWLLAVPKGTRLCGYYLGYDWTKILSDLPDASIYRLLRPELRVLPADEGGGFSYVRWGQFKLHYLSGMMRIKRGQEKVTIWDLGKFFQSTFVQALLAWGILPKAKLDAMQRMKDIRAEFCDRDRESIRSYMISECAALAELAADLEQAHEDVGLKLSTWHGPGSTASAMLKNWGIHEKRGEHPVGVEYAANCAFFGGRFEHSTIGDHDGCFGYDIVSAYPWQLYNLPCLEHAEWRWIEDEKALDTCNQACVSYELTDIGDVSWAPLPCRLDTGAIVFPRSGSRGYVWLAEYRTARRHFRGVKFTGAWALFNTCACRPFASILDMFLERERLGKTGKGRVVKNAINSGYGKIAQTIGKPKFASRIWAGIITSGTRAQLLELAVNHKSLSSVKAMATDGLYSTEDLTLPSAPLSQCSLGSWEKKSMGRMTFVRPGIYWSHKEDDETVRSRGISKRQFKGQREAVREAIECGDERADIGTSTLFGSAKACVYKLRDGTFKRSRHYGEWHDIPAYVSLTPAPKRRPDWSLHRLPNVQSIPYDKAALSDDAKALSALGNLFWGNR